MTPPSVEAALIILVAVLPGAAYIWSFEREVGPVGVAFADRVLRFVAVSVLLHLAFGWLEYAMWRTVVDGHPQLGAEQFAALWAGVLVLTGLPWLAGWITGRLYVTRNLVERDDPLRRLLLLDGPRGSRREEWLLKLLVGRVPTRRAWDSLFTPRPECYLRVRTIDGKWIAGRFAEDSFAGTYPAGRDLFLEEVVALDDDDELLDEGLGYAVYIPEHQIAWVDVIGEW